MKAPASNRLRGIDELILIIFSLLWKPSIRAGLTPARDGGLRGYSFEYFCARAQSETSSSGCGESALRVHRRTPSLSGFAAFWLIAAYQCFVTELSASSSSVPSRMASA